MAFVVVNKQMQQEYVIKHFETEGSKPAGIHKIPTVQFSTDKNTGV
jgi:hypothetical protein